MQTAERALAAGDLATTSAKVDEHARRFAARAADWRESTRIRVLLRAGQRDEARARIDRFAKLHPNDPRLAAFRKAVAASEPTP